MAHRATLLCMLAFFAQPIQFGLWLSRIAEVQADLGLTKAELSLALLGMPLGLLPFLYFAGRTVERVGPRRTLIWALPPMLAAGVLPGFASNATNLFFSLFLLGTTIATTEVGLNVFAARVEKTYSQSIMNRAHGFWSLGVMTGSLIGVQLAHFELPAGHSLLVAALFLLPLLIAIGLAMPTIKNKEEMAAKSRNSPPIPPALYLIGLVVFGGTMVEGGMNDWATVYMRESVWGGSSRDGLAVTVFAGTVTFGRFVGDALKNRFGAVRLAKLCLGSAFTGILILVFSKDIWTAYAGFALVGFGVSTIFPLGVSASAELGDIGEARNVSVMTFGALTAFLIGPPMIGLVAEATSLRIAFIPLLIALAVSLYLAQSLQTNRS